MKKNNTTNLKTDEKKESVNADNTIWVISTGRVGSTLMSTLITDDKSNKLIEHQIPGARPINILGNLTCAGMISVELAGKLSRTLFGLKYGESTTDPLRSMLLSAEILNDVVSVKPKIIHVVRDPRDFVSSFMNWKDQKIKRKILHHIIPFWQPTPWIVGESSFMERMSMSKFEHFCWIWRYKNELFERLEMKGEYKRFHFEDIVQGDTEESSAISELNNFLEFSNNEKSVNRPSKKVNKSKGKFPKWINWTPQQAAILDKHCGELMRKYGYGKEKEWSLLLAK